jgi:hypothetical protein
MKPVTKPGPQPPCCIVEDCPNDPVAGDVHCAGHLRYMQTHNGSAITPPIVEPDDPDVLARAAAQAATQEQREYAERRRVKTWKTLENGTRIPEEFYTDAELAAIEARAEDDAAALSGRLGNAAALSGRLENVRLVATRLAVSRVWFDDARGFQAAAAHPAEDPVKAATKVFKAALKGKLGELAQEHAWSTARLLADMR